MDNGKLNVNLIMSVYDILLNAADKSGILQVLTECAEKYGLSKVCLYEPDDENPEIRCSCIYEKKPSAELRKKTFLLKDYIRKNKNDEHALQEGMFVCEDSGKQSDGRITDAIIQMSHACSYLGYTVYENDLYSATLLFIDSENSREWDEETRNTIKRVAEIISKFLVKQNYYHIQKTLSKDYRIMAEEAEAIKVKFLSNMSHEIKNPLSAIIGMTTIMRHCPEDITTLSQCVDKIEQASNQLLKLVNGCMDITLFDDTSSLLNNVWFTFENIEEAILHGNVYLSTGKKHSFEMDYPKNRQVCGDRDKLIGIINGLLHNAFRFTPPEGKVTLKIREREINNRKTIFSFVVEDNGVGIDDQFIPILFDPFSKEITSQGGQNEGNGLGLTMVRHLVDLLNGEISAYSQKGKGTAVTFEIPLEEDKKEADYGNESEDYEFTGTYVGRRVLIAEDNSLMAEVLMTLLGYKGLETDWAVNGKEALDKFLKHDAFYYDIILMDLQMPVKDGYTATKEIRGSDKADAGMIPIIALSSEGFNDAIEKAKDCGMNCYLNKPIGEKELISLISRYVL